MEYSWYYCGVCYVLSEDISDPGMVFPQVKDAERVINGILPPYSIDPALRGLVQHAKGRSLALGDGDLEFELVWLLHTGRLRLSVKNQTYIPAAEAAGGGSTVADPVIKYAFTYSNEVWKGHSNVPHWPGGESGLTLGPGYDIGSRKSTDVENFLTRKLGLKQADAKLFADGAGLRGAAASTYLDKNAAALRKHVVITDAQEQELFRLIAPTYEAKIPIHIKEFGFPEGAINWLTPEQMEVLFDYEYNPGKRRERMFRAMLKNDWNAALKYYKRGVKRRDTEMGEKLRRMKLESDRQRIPLMWNLPSGQMLG